MVGTSLSRCAQAATTQAAGGIWLTYTSPTTTMVMATMMRKATSATRQPRMSDTGRSIGAALIAARLGAPPGSRLTMAVMISTMKSSTAVSSPRSSEPARQHEPERAEKDQHGDDSQDRARRRQGPACVHVLPAQPHVDTRR